MPERDVTLVDCQALHGLIWRAKAAGDHRQIVTPTEQPAVATTARGSAPCVQIRGKGMARRTAKRGTNAGHEGHGRKQVYRSRRAWA